MELNIQIPGGQKSIDITGLQQRNLKLIRETLDVNIVARDGSVHISGKNGNVSKAAQAVEKLTQAADNHHPLTEEQLLEFITSGHNKYSVITHTDDHLADNVNGAHQPAPGLPDNNKSSLSDNHDTVDNNSAKELNVYLDGRRVKPLTKGQQYYLKSLQEHDLTFCSGPAGSGKTYLAVAAAVSMLKREEVRKLVLVRPAVEAGERLGFLPGSMQEKVNPYLRPLLDALQDMMEFDHLQRFMACDLIEIVPLAFMRGRTLNNALIILDEAQNTTKSQMLMFLTRLGHGSKMIVTGDTSQIDLEDPRDSGLVDAVRRLRNTEGIATVALDKADIVRHNLVQRIIKAYE